jgi:adenylate kinase
MRIVFIGPPGAGKGTQSARLVEYLKVPHLSTGDILRQAREEKTKVGLMAAEYIDAGRLVPDSVVVEIIDERIRQPDCVGGCLFDGFPRTLSQAESLDVHLADRGAPLDLVLAVDVPENVLFERLAVRGRDDDNLDIIRKRLGEYQTMTKPLLDYYRSKGLLHLIDGVGTPDEVFNRIKAAIDNV